MPQMPVECALCGKTLPITASYVVRIDVFADPTLPDLHTADLDANGPASLQAITEELEKCDPQQLQDDVHKRFEYHLCPRCRRGFMANPLGLPRHREPAVN